MGDVVALSSFESNRGAKQVDRSGNESAEVVMFTGVRYERISDGSEAQKFKNERARLKIGLPLGSK